MIIGIDASRVSLDKKTGTENYSWYLIQAIAKIDKNNTYILYTNRTSDKPLINQPNFQEIQIPANRLWTQYHLACRLFKDSLDIIFVPAHTIPVIRPRSIKTVVTIHDLGAEYLKQYHQFPHRFYLNSSTEYALKHVDHIIAVSQATKNDIVKDFGRDESTVTVIHEGYNEKLYDFKVVENSKKELSHVFEKYKIKSPYFLFVGTIQPRKNISQLTSSFANIKNKEAQLLLVGKKGWLYKEILELPEILGIEDRVKFLDYVSDEDLPFLYYGAKGFVFPSLCEGFGIPLLEAMAMGCPIMTSQLSSMPEIVDDAAILVDPYDGVAITTALDTLLEDKKLIDKLIMKGFARVKKFSWLKTAKETIKVFEKVNNNEKFT